MMQPRCRFEGCQREPAFPDQAYCESHALRWTPGKPVEREQFVPEWRRRLVAKDLTGRLAA